MINSIIIILNVIIYLVFIIIVIIFELTKPSDAKQCGARFIEGMLLRKFQEISRNFKN